MNDTPHDVQHQEPKEEQRLYCGDCMFCEPGPNTAHDVFSRVCYRNPPVALAVMTQKGLAVISVRPEIRPDTWACGEFSDEDATPPETVS